MCTEKAEIVWSMCLVRRAVRVVTLMVTLSGLHYSALAKGDDVVASQMYPLFYAYRTALNQSNSIEGLAHYFSAAFNDYYQSRLTTKNKARHSVSLNQYWNNLRWGTDILVVTEYAINRQAVDRVELLLVYMNDSPTSSGLESTQVQTLPLKHVIVEYIKEAGDWKIHSFEFNMNQSPKQRFDPEKTIDNFVELE